MTTESNTSIETGAAQEQEAGETPRRRRVARKAAGAPTPVQSTTDNSALPTVAGSAGGEPVVTVAPPKRRRRSANRTASAPSVTAVTAQAGEPTVVTDPPRLASDPEAPQQTIARVENNAATTRGGPATGDALFDLPDAGDNAGSGAVESRESRGGRRRSRRSAAEGRVADTPQEATDTNDNTDDENGDDDSSGRPRRRRSRRRHSGRNTVTDEATQAAADAEDSTEDGDAEATAQITADADVEDTEQDTPRTAASTHALLFQAPDPATVPVKPAAREEQASDDEDEDDESDADSGSDSDDDSGSRRRRRRRGGRGRRKRGDDGSSDETEKPDNSDVDPAASDSGSDDSDGDDDSSSRRRRRRRRRNGTDEGGDTGVTGVKGSTRLEAKRQRRRDGRDSGRRRQVVTEAEFLARRESVERALVVREFDGRTQVAVLEDDVLVEHYVARKSQRSMIGNVHVGRVQNVLPSMEAAFVDIGKGRNAVLYAGEVNWDAVGLEGGAPRRIESALKSGDSVLVQVTKDPMGHKGPRLTSQISLPGRYLVYVPGQNMTGISRKLPDTERTRLKKILKAVVPEDAGVIVRTAAEGASEEELRADVERLRNQWERIEKKAKTAQPPSLLYKEPDLAVKSIRDVFNEDFKSLTVSGDEAWSTVSNYVADLAPDLADRVHQWDPAVDGDVFAVKRLDEQILKALDRKVYLPSGGSLVIDRTEAMTVVDVNTGKFTGSGGNLEATVTKNNLEAAEEIVRQLRLRDIGGIIVIDFIDMVLESNRDLVLRRLLECLSRDRTKHQVAEVTSLGLVQMTRKRIGQGLVEGFGEQCSSCDGQGVVFKDVPGMYGATTNTGENKDQQRRAAGAAAVARVAAATKAATDLTEDDEVEPDDDVAEVSDTQGELKLTDKAG